MAKSDQIWQDFSELPASAQELVIDFINFLRTKYGADEGAASETLYLEYLETVNEDSFIGMWAERTDLADSSGWVRNTRLAEWRTGYE